MFRKKKKVKDLSPQTQEQRRAKAEAEATKALDDDIRRSKYLSRFALLLIVAILVGSLLFSKSSPGSVLNTAIPLDEVILDPHKTLNYWEAGLCSLIYEGLVKPKNKLLLYDELVFENSVSDTEEFWSRTSRLEVEPSLAESWNSDPGGLTWTFTLRKNVNFHNEQVVNSSCVIASFARLLGFSDFSRHKENEFPARKIFIQKDGAGVIINGIKNIKSLGEFEVEFELAEPDPLFLQRLALPLAAIFSPQSLNREKSDGRSISDNPVGTGPFRVKKIDKNDFVILERFNEYWGKKAAQRTVYISFLNDDNYQFMALKNGELNLTTGNSMSSILQSDDLKTLKIFQGTTPYLTSIVVNPFADDETSELLRNSELRQTVLNAFSPREIYKKGLHSFFDEEIFPKNIKGSRTVTDEGYIAETLKKSGFDAKKQLRIQLTFPILNTGLQPDIEFVAEEMKKQFDEVGIELKLKALPEKEFFKSWVEGKISLTFADFELDNFYSAENFFYFAAVNIPKEDNLPAAQTRNSENAKGNNPINLIRKFLEAKNYKELAKAKKSANENFLLKMLGRSNSFYIILKDIAGKAPRKFYSFFELLSAPEDD